MFKRLLYCCLSKCSIVIKHSQSTYIHQYMIVSTCRSSSDSSSSSSDLSGTHRQFWCLCSYYFRAHRFILKMVDHSKMFLFQECLSLFSCGWHSDGWEAMNVCYVFLWPARYQILLTHPNRPDIPADTLHVLQKHTNTHRWALSFAHTQIYTRTHILAKAVKALITWMQDCVEWDGWGPQWQKAKWFPNVKSYAVDTLRSFYTFSYIPRLKHWLF